MTRLALTFLLFVAALTLALATMPPLDSHGLWKGRSIAAITLLTHAVSLFALDNARVPTQDEGLTALVKKPSAGAAGWKPYVRNLPTDSWGNPYIYKIIDANRNTFVIYSAGPNGTDDDQRFDDVIVGDKHYPCELYDNCYTATDYVSMAALAITGALALTLIWQVSRLLCSVLITKYGRKA